MDELTAMVVMTAAIFAVLGLIEWGYRWDERRGEAPESKANINQPQPKGSRDNPVTPP